VEQLYQSYIDKGYSLLTLQSPGIQDVAGLDRHPVVNTCTPTVSLAVPFIPALTACRRFLLASKSFCDALNNCRL
jgi:hypothetical protein